MLDIISYNWEIFYILVSAVVALVANIYWVYRYKSRWSENPPQVPTTTFALLFGLFWVVSIPILILAALSGGSENG
jgi:hypothetical protein